MPAGFRGFQREPGALLRLRVRKGLRREKRVILSAQYQSRHVDGGQELPRTAFRPVVFSIPEPMYGRCKSTVKILKSMDTSGVARVNAFREMPGLGFNLAHKTCDQPSQVDAVGPPLIQRARTGGKIDGRRHRNGADYCRMGPRFAKIFQHEIPAQAESDQAPRSETVSLRDQRPSQDRSFPRCDRAGPAGSSLRCSRDSSTPAHPIRPGARLRPSRA